MATVTYHHDEKTRAEQEDLAEDIPYALAISKLLVSAGIHNRLVKQFGSHKDAWLASESALKYCFRQQPALERFVAERKSIDPRALLEPYLRQNIHILTQHSEAYPELLKTTHDAPAILYVKGNVEALSSKNLAIVGTRRITNYGVQMTERLVSELAPWHPCIVSGLAEGVDTIAHKAALESKLQTIAVFGTGIDMVFPATNNRLVEAIGESGGAVISELPLGTPGDKFNFPNRNRIIAGLSLVTLVIEAPDRSGALITARNALEENRCVMALPGPANIQQSQGTNKLIQQGAHLIMRGQDIAEALNWPLPHGNKKPATQQSLLDSIEPTIMASLNPVEKQLLKAIAFETIDIDTLLAGNNDLTLQALQHCLTRLELLGLITSLPGGKYIRI